jgi:hypothetical protein
MEAFKAFSLALSVLSCAFSALSCAISISISRTGRQLSIDKNCRHRGSNEGDAPLLLEREAAAGDGDLVIGGEQGDQAEEQAADGLDEAEPIETGPGAQGTLDSGGAAGGWRAGLSGSGMGLEAEAGKGARSGSRCGSLFSSATLALRWPSGKAREDRRHLAAPMG